MSATDFWQEHQVGGPYETLADSLKALEDRELLYPYLYELMPVSFPGKTILDYGCGPGHDTILFLRNKAKKVYFADVSWQALQTTNDRLKMHDLRERAYPILLPDFLPKVDHIHCAGVLHHCEDPLGILKQFRLLGADVSIMVYDGEISEISQSAVPITEWWNRKEFKALALAAGFNVEYVGSYPCSAEWRPNCYAACYSLT